MYHSEYRATGRYVNNDQFIIAKYKNGPFRASKKVLKEMNERFETSGMLQWSGKKKLTCAYDTVAFSFFKKYAIYGNTPNNLNAALWRITSARLDSLEEHKVLFENQSEYFEKVHKRLDEVGSYLHILNTTFLQLRETQNFQRDIEIFANMPHPKRHLRLRALQRLNELGWLLEETLILRVKGKVKTCEKAKYGKKPRLIGDYSTEASLLGPFIVDKVKQCFLRNIAQVRGNTVLFCDSPSPESLGEVFKRHKHTGAFNCTYYSDDMIMSFNVGGRVFHFNVDISSCDMSNGLSVFNTLFKIVEGDQMATDVVRRLIKQCSHNVRCYNPHDMGEFYEFKSDGPKEYSGTVITTLLNNIASSNISLSVEEGFTPGHDYTHLELEQLIVDSARKCGYIVTVSKRSDYAHLQFLKNSPTESGDSYVNLGVLLRGLGGITGDFPGSGDLDARVESFIGSVVEGYKHSGDNSITRALRKRFPPPRKLVKLTLNHLNTYIIPTTGDEAVVDDIDLINRYQITSSDIAELVDRIENLKIGDIINVTATNNIFHVDYEYPLQKLF